MFCFLYFITILTTVFFPWIFFVNVSLVSDNIPPEVSRKGHEEIFTFIKHLQNGKQPFFHARGMVVGCAGTGKSSLIKRMQKQLNTQTISEETRAVQVYEHMFAIDNGKLSGKFFSEWI